MKVLLESDLTSRSAMLVRDMAEGSKRCLDNCNPEETGMQTKFAPEVQLVEGLGL